MNKGIQTKWMMILMIIGLMVAMVVIMGQSLEQGSQDAFSDIAVDPNEDEAMRVRSPIEAERGVFRAVDQTSRFVDTTGAPRRLLSQVYARRAYPGAPPFIPHLVETTMGSDFKSCLGCHEHGGFAPQFNAYTPVTPHPNFINCRQCHVSQFQTDLFVETTFRTVEPPVLGRAALPGGPPPIPHDLQLRENCSACHSGPAAAQDIRTSHPERLNCRQCHVPTGAEPLFVRTGPKEWEP